MSRYHLFAGPSTSVGKYDNGIFLPNTANSDDNFISLGTHSNDCFGSVTLCPNGVTFSLWFKPDSQFGTWSHLCQSTYIHGFFKQLANGNLKLSIDFRNGTHRYRYDSLPEIILNMWHHLGITYSAKYGLNIYFDGVVQTGNFAIISSGISPKTWELGCTGKKFCIRIMYDDLRFWKMWKNPELVLRLWSM